MRIFTSYFGNLKKLAAAGVVPISISRFPPKWFSGARLMDLAPTGDMLKMSKPLYEQKFNVILSKRQPEEYVKMFERISIENGGADIAICCFEALKTPGEWCHRTMVADYLNLHLNLGIKEFGVTESTQRSIFDSEVEDI